MEYQCINKECREVFRPHTFTAMRHPSQVRCPVCDSRGKITERGRENRKSRFHAVNQANAAATLKEKSNE